MCCVFADISTCFEGELPKELGNLVNLIYFYLNVNKFEGEFVCSNIHVFVFADIFTCFSGVLPKELGNLVNLERLVLYGNAFQGEPQHTCVCARFADISTMLCR